MRRYLALFRQVTGVVISVHSASFFILMISALEKSSEFRKNARTAPSPNSFSGSKKKRKVNKLIVMTDSFEIHLKK